MVRAIEEHRAGGGAVLAASHVPLPERGVTVRIEDGAYIGNFARITAAAMKDDA